MKPLYKNFQESKIHNKELPFITKAILLFLFSSSFFCANSQSISGTVFEDVNYGGGAGRNLVSSTGQVRPGARVELYDKDGLYLNFTNTDVAGQYTFSGLLPDLYFVRIVNQTVSSSRPGWVATLFPVQTYRTEAVIVGVTTSVVDRVGGEIPAEQDAPANTTNLSLATLNAVINQEVQSLANVNISLAGSSASGLDFGFNFDIVVNTNNAGQGSFRQFITNANALGGEALLAQNGFTWNSIDSVNAAILLPAGRETSLFMIADGNAHPGLRSGLPNLLNGFGVAVINPVTTLLSINGINAIKTTIDGGTQTANIGNTNNLMLGTGGTVGIGPDAVAGTGDEMKLPQINGPEIELATNGLPAAVSGLAVAADSVTVRNISIHSSPQYDILIGTPYGTTIEQCMVGTTANSFTAPAVLTLLENIRISNGAISGVVKNCLVGFCSLSSKIMGAFRSTSNVQWSILHNEIAGNNSGAGLAFNSFGAALGTWGLIKIKGNLSRNHGPAGISADLDYRSNPTGLMAKIIEENTVRNNLSCGIQAIQGDGNDTIRHNLIHNNGAMGVRVSKRDGASINRVKITRNSIRDNGTLGIDLDENLVSANNGTVDPTAVLANNNIDYPVITYVSLSGTQLTVMGYVGTPPGLPLFANVEIEIFKAKNDGNQNGELIVGDLLSIPHGEGERFLGNTFTDASGTFMTTLTVSGITMSDVLTATATDAQGNTSEFGAYSPYIVLPLKLKYFYATGNNNAALLDWGIDDMNIDAHRFVIERSADGVHFTSINGFATSITGINGRYSCVDPNPLSGINYYRIKYTKQDGSTVYSEARMLHMKKAIRMEWSPNPVTGFGKIHFNTVFKKADISIVNAEGKLMWAQKIAPDQDHVLINCTTFPAGLYHAKLLLDGNTETISFVKE